MSGRKVVSQTFQQVRPVLSLDAADSRRRVLALYKSWSRQIPYIGKYMITYQKCNGRPRTISKSITNLLTNRAQCLFKI